MRVCIRNTALLLTLAATLASCGFVARREVYHGDNGEPLAAIVSTIASAERSVLARSPSLPRPAVVEALAAARARAVLVEFVVCGDPESAGEGSIAPAEVVPIRFDQADHPKTGAVFVIDIRTVVRSSYAGKHGRETVMIIRDTPDLGERIAAECRSHIARGPTEPRASSAR